jgi:hypothetical protein
MTLRDTRKTQKAIMKIKNKDISNIEKGIRDDIKKTQKKRAKKYKMIRKTIKTMISDEKRRQRETRREEKRLLKIRRQQENHIEEINHELLQGLVNKYRGKIMEDLVDLDEHVVEKEQEKNKKKLVQTRITQNSRGLGVMNKVDKKTRKKKE